MLLLKKHFNHFNDTHPTTILKLFDSITRPALLYNSEVWGVFEWRKMESIKTILTNFKSQYESLHIKMCKQSLGLKKYATNLAVLGEMGRFPLIIFIITSILKYWLRG